MKNLRTALLCASFALSTTGLLAQEKPVPVNEPNYNKPQLFSGQPDKIILNAEDLNELFSAPVGSPTSIKMSSDSRSLFEGEVISSGSKNQNKLQSMVIRSTNFNGARFSLSKIIRTDGSVTYTGRILSFQHGDAYVLQYLDGAYTLVKKNFYDLVNE